MKFRPDFAWVVFGRVVTALIAIASLRIMTHLFEPKDYGIYVLLVAFQGFCGLFLINPVGQHINRHTHAWWDDGTLLKRFAGFNIYLSAVSVGIAIVVVVWWLLFPNMDKNVLSSILAAISVSAMVYLGTWNTVFVYSLNMLGFRSESVTWMTASSIVGLAFSTILAYQYHTAISWVLGQALGMAVGAIGAGKIIQKYQAASSHGQNDSSDLPTLLDKQTILKYCFPLAVATGFLWLQNTGYRFWVGGVWGVAELGILAIGLSISSQLWSILESLATQFLNPYFFRHITEAKTDAQMSAVLSDMVNVMWPLYAVFAGFNMLFASSLLIALTDYRYHAAVAFVMLGALIEFARCTANLWSYAAQIQRRTTKIILPYVLGAIVVWLAIFGISTFNGSLKILAVALLVSGIVACVTMIVLMQRMLPVIIDVNRWLAGSVILIISIIMVVFMPVQNHSFYQNALYLFLGVIVWGCCMTVFLLHNPSLKRLLSVSLRSA